MENLNTYIAQVRQSGKTDEQIRQNLVAAGWQVEQINQVLNQEVPQSEVSTSSTTGQVIPGGFQPATPTPVNSSVLPVTMAPQPVKKTPFKFLATIGIIVAVLVVASGVSYALFFHKVSYKTVAQDFVAAMEKGDKAKADSLISPGGKAQLKKYTGSTSYYDICKKTGTTCTYYFSSKFLDKATVTTKNESSKNGVQKRQVIYTLKESSNSKSSDCTSKGSSTSTLAIELESKGNTWVINGANPAANFSASLCPTDATTTTDGSSSSDSSDSNRTHAIGEEANQKGQRRPQQYLHICTTVDRTIYYSQGSPSCLGNDTLTQESSPTAAGTVYSSPCQTDSGPLRYIYISTRETCPSGTTLLFYNNL